MIRFASHKNLYLHCTICILTAYLFWKIVQIHSLALGGAAGNNLCWMRGVIFLTIVGPFDGDIFWLLSNRWIACIHPCNTVSSTALHITLSIFKQRWSSRDLSKRCLRKAKSVPSLLETSIIGISGGFITVIASCWLRYSWDNSSPSFI